ncbi:DNA topoisomerase family protein [Cryptosporidium serpentis]
MVAEKPSIAETVAKVLSNGNLNTRQCKTPVHEYTAHFQHKRAFFKVTSVSGHVFETDFPSKYSNWESTDPVDLFDLPTVKNESSSKMTAHLLREAKNCDFLVLWLDCDREGENICFEVISVVKDVMAKGRNESLWIFRARFSSVAPKDVIEAMNNLKSPNKDEADAVDVRQELDLKIGVAFSRFQTTYLKTKYGDFNNSILSYGPCQTPTLFFVVQRRDKILGFTPEKFYYLTVTIEYKNVILSPTWERKKIFDLQSIQCLYNTVNSTYPIIAKVIDIKKKADRTSRPLPLNTVQMLKLASNILGISPFQAMSIAEKLYLSGFITYPRTETTKYPKSFDMKEAASIHRDHPLWGQYTCDILARNYTNPRQDGIDVGDHPPIVPIRSVTSNDLAGDNWRLYELITRHFLATISPDIKFTNEFIMFDINGEKFILQGRRIDEYGFSIIDKSKNINSISIPQLDLGMKLNLKSIEICNGETKPPPLLSEGNLLSLMEKNGIGTDASMPVHIQKLIERKYVNLVDGRKLEPTRLGNALIHGYMNIDIELVYPMIRSEMERYINLIAQGKANARNVLKHTLAIFKLKFLFFVKNIASFESLFQLSFTNLSSSGTRLSRCGQCKRYMTYISNTNSPKLYCSFCEINLKLPNGGSLKLYKELKCPLDDYELLVFNSLRTKKNMILCPRCYNDPPFDSAIQNTPCKECPHPTCPHSYNSSFIMYCPVEKCKDGVLTLDLSSAPNWRIDCSNCNFVLKFREKHCHKVSTTNDYCNNCGARILLVNLNSPKESIIGCPICLERINELIEAEENSVSKRISIRSKFRGGKRKHKGKLRK